MRTILGRAVVALACAALAAPNFAWAGSVNIPEGTEFLLRLEDKLSSKDTQEGDHFTVTLSEDVKLPDGVVLKAGYHGTGEVTEARKSGMLGKTGKLNVRINYLKVGEQRIRLRASKGAQGNHNTGVQVMTFVLLWPAAALIKGHNTEIKKGTVLNAFSDSDISLDTPIEPPPELS